VACGVLLPLPLTVGADLLGRRIQSQLSREIDTKRKEVQVSSRFFGRDCYNYMINTLLEVHAQYLMSRQALLAPLTYRSLAPEPSQGIA
jgi:hypothetical protein